MTIDITVLILARLDVGSDLSVSLGIYLAEIRVRCEFGNLDERILGNSPRTSSSLVMGSVHRTSESLGVHFIWANDGQLCSYTDLGGTVFAVRLEV